MEVASICFALGSIVTASICVLLAWKFITCKYSFIPTPYNIPVFGSGLHIKRNPVEFTKQLIDLTLEHDHLFKLWIFSLPVIFSSTTEYSRALLQCPRNIKKSFMYCFFEKWLGTGVVLSTGDKWKTRRRMLTPSFSFSTLEGFSNIFEKNALKLVDELKRDTSEKINAIDIQPLASLRALAAVCETSMGLKLEESSQEKEYLQKITTIKKLLMQQAYNPLYALDFIYRKTLDGKILFKCLKNVHDFTLSMIDKRIKLKSQTTDAEKNFKNEKKSVKTDNTTGLYLIDTLLEFYQKGSIDVPGIREEVDTFVFSGHDTTSVAVSFCLYCLGRYPEYQRKLQNEIDTSGDGDVPEKIKNMKFLDYCLKESLRLFPPLPFIGRTLVEDMIIDGRKIFKGTCIHLNIFMLHRNEKYWENPLVFDPYRFEEENVRKREPFCYIPFSAGPRSCIAQRYAITEIKILLYYILKNFNVKSIQKEEELNLSASAVLKCEDGLFLQLEQR